MGYSITYNNKSNDELDIEVIKRPVIPIAIRRFKTIEIEGHDGNYYIDEETYEDITFSIEFNFVEDNVNNIRNRVRKIKRWIENAKDNKLRLSDNKGYYYRVCKAEISEFTYGDIYEIQSFSVNFTVEPYQYISDNEELTLSTTMYNNWDICQPTYRIVGNGNCILNVNGNIVNCTVNGQLTIDTAHDKILNSDKTLAIGKTDIKKMQNLYLQEEENTFSWTSGFTIYIIPNWRSL